MKKIGIALCAATAFLLSPAAAKAFVLTFDDVPGADPYMTYNPIPNGYGGFDWDYSFRLAHKDQYPGGGYVHGTVSGEWAAYNALGTTVLISRQDTFHFTGAYFSSAFDLSQTLSLKGWRDGTELFSTALEIKNNASRWVQVDWSGIDTLELGSSGWSFVMDDFTFNESPNPVPEPGTMVLLASGLIVFMARVRSKDMSGGDIVNS
ncbi:MAG: PEP-CTERM sorting domain-containing protein [Desulfobulbus sp.]|jgi:hypothetical protein